jgi:hypothetical protein
VSFYVANGLGDHIKAPSVDQMRQFLADVDTTDEEHGAAWLSTDGGYSLEWNGAALVFSVPDAYARPRHMPKVSRERALELWIALANGDFDAVERCDWLPGNGHVPDPEREAKFRAWQLQNDREFYDVLGDERPEVPCRTDGCTRGAIKFSVLCRVHHFESVKKRPSPFQD